MFSFKAIYESIVGRLALPDPKALVEKALDDALAEVKRSVDDKIAKKGAQALARAVYKSIGAIGHPATGLPTQARHDAALALTEQIAAQADQVAAAIRSYGAAQAQLELDRGTAAEEASRKLRESGEKQLQQQLADIARAAIGQDPQGE